jgi:hypothetical protein
MYVYIYIFTWHHFVARIKTNYDIPESFRDLDTHVAQNAMCTNHSHILARLGSKLPDHTMSCSAGTHQCCRQH